MKIVKLFGCAGMFVLITIFGVVAIAAVQNSAIIPVAQNYLYATIFGAFFGFFIGLFGFWFSTGKPASDTRTLRLALPIVSIVGASVFFWVYALAVAGIHGLGHPVWASIIFGVTTLALCIWAAMHQLNYSSKRSR